PRAEHDAALAAADDQAIGLFAGAEFTRLARPRLRPGLAFGVGLVAHAERPRRALAFLESLEVGHRREQGAATAVAQAQDALARGHCGLECEPGLDRAFVRGCFAGELPSRWLGRGER